MAHPPCNMLPQTAYRKPLREGDIFVMKYGENRFLFGRIARVLPEPTYLVYVYRDEASSADEIPDLSIDRLLIPPRIVNRLGFSRGFMRVIANRPLKRNNAYPAHSFRLNSFRGRSSYQDEDGHPLTEPTGCIVDKAYGNYRTLDDEISRALGLSLAPNET